MEPENAVGRGIFFPKHNLFFSFLMLSAVMCESLQLSVEKKRHLTDEEQLMNTTICVLRVNCKEKNRMMTVNLVCQKIFNKLEN